MSRRRTDSENRGEGRGSGPPHDGFGDQGELLPSHRKPEARGGGDESTRGERAAREESAGRRYAGGRSEGRSGAQPRGGHEDEPGESEGPGQGGRSPAPREGDAGLARAEALFEEGRLGAAVAAFKDVIMGRPDSVAARLGLGATYERMGQIDRALEQLEAARELAPEEVVVLTRLGGALAAAGRFEDAERELRKAFKIDPEHLEVRATLGILYFRRGLYGQAETELRWVCERDEDHGPAHFYRGEALNRLGRVELAVAVLQKAVYLQPRNAKAYYTLGILFDKKNMPEEASRMYRRAREVART